MLFEPAVSGLWTDYRDSLINPSAHPLAVNTPSSPVNTYFRQQRMFCSKNKFVSVLFVSVSAVFVLYHAVDSSYLPLFWTPSSSFSSALPEDFLKADAAEWAVDPGRIHILSIINHENDSSIYRKAMDTVSCYSLFQGYHLQFFVVDDLEDGIYSRCRHPDFFFKRHCILHTFMEAHLEEVQWILFIDTDMGVVNPHKRIEHYIEYAARVPPGHPEIVFYDRMFNWEIAAGSFLARNSNYSRAFLKYWADYQYHVPDSMHGWDNGAIHQVLMDYEFRNDDKARFACYPLWKNSTSFADLGVFEACVRDALNYSRNTLDRGRIRIFKKYEQAAWVRDAFFTDSQFSDNDFMLHGWKETGRWEGWQWPFYTSEFDQDNCLNDTANWVTFPGWKTTDQDISEKLKDMEHSVQYKYNHMLPFMRAKLKAAP